MAINKTEKMKMNYAKLFETEIYGQILVKIDTDDDGLPEVRFFFSPEDFGVCSVAAKYESEEKWEAAERFFGEVNEDSALSVVGKALSAMNLS